MYDLITLDNGLRIIGLRMKEFRSVSIGLWVHSGSVYEAQAEAGISHFIEHMVFKGTERRTARQIAEEMDAIGGNMNAFTDRENTCFYAKVIDEHLPIAMDMIADMILHSRFDPSDMEKEKGVIIEEINMCEDTPDDLVFELAGIAHYGRQPISLPVLGTEESVSAIQRAQILDYMSRRYRPEGAVLALAGNYDWDKVIAQAKDLFGSWEHSGAQRPVISTVRAPHSVIRRAKEIEQSHICISYDAPCALSPEQYPLRILCGIFGGSMSSRLFQTIREERGLAYSVYSTLSACADSGLFMIYAGTSPENLHCAAEIALEEAEKLVKNGVTQKEFDMARAQALSSIIMAMESTSNRMISIGRRLLMEEKTCIPDEIIGRYKAVTIEQVNELARRIFTSARSASIVGAGTDTVPDSMIL